MDGKSIDELQIGDYAEQTKTIAECDVYMYAGITGDMNPAHIEAQKGIFKQRVAHGMLTAGLISAAIGMKLPGPGTIYVSQNLKFTAPVNFGDTITARVEIVDCNLSRNRATLKTTCFNQHSKVVLDGQAIVIPPKKKV